MADAGKLSRERIKEMAKIYDYSLAHRYMTVISSDDCEDVYQALRELLSAREHIDQQNDQIVQRDELLAQQGEQIAALRAALEEIRDCILNEREGMAEMNFGSDRVNAVLGIIDDRIDHAKIGRNADGTWR